MNLLIAMAVGVLFGTGAFLALKPDLFRVAVGVALISNASVLALVGSGLSRGDAPVLPADDPADPLVQAMALTALVIGLGVIVLLVGIAARIYRTQDTVDLDDLARAEERAEEQTEERAEDEEEREP